MGGCGSTRLFNLLVMMYPDALGLASTPATTETLNRLRAPADKASREMRSLHDLVRDVEHPSQSRFTTTGYTPGQGPYPHGS